jgi:hypothetical protein
MTIKVKNFKWGGLEILVTEENMVAYLERVSKAARDDTLLFRCV